MDKLIDALETKHPGYTVEDVRLIVLDPEAEVDLLEVEDDLVEAVENAELLDKFPPDM